MTSQNDQMFPRLSTDWERLLGLEDGKLDEYLVALFEKCETSPGPFKFDRLMGIGIRLARAGRRGTDRTALKWVEKQPTARRLDIAAALLSGLWGDESHSHPVTAECVRAFIRLRGTIVLDDESAYSSLMALSKIADSAAEPDAKEEVAQVMRLAGGEHYENGVIERQAQELIKTSLRRLMPDHNQRKET